LQRAGFGGAGNFRFVLQHKTSDPSLADEPPAANAISKGATLTDLLVGVIAFQLNASMVTPAVPEIARKLSSTPGLVAISQPLFFLVGGIAGIVLTRMPLGEILFCASTKRFCSAAKKREPHP